MKSIGIVICNYNKKDCVLACIRSVLESSITDYDIYVVDNASTDGSAEAILTKYGSSVTVIRNETNLGGSGGFNTGIRKVVVKGYTYVCCLDNDVLLDEKALENLRELLKANQDVGMAGAKIYHMQNSAYIQQFGIEIDFKNCQGRTLYADVVDSETIPEVVYCDTVAACAVMLPVPVVEKVGVMPEDNFIYWDDMEWGYRIKLNGYKVAAIASAKALHKMGSNERKENTFIQYYMWRNRIHFFMKYTRREELEKMSVTMLSSVFYDIYEAIYRNEYNISQTLIMAYKDALDGIRGKAKEGRILKNDGNITDFLSYFQKVNSITAPKEQAWLKRIFDMLSLPVTVNPLSDRSDEQVFVCESILNQKDIKADRVYVDKNLNIIVSKEDAEMLKNWDFSLGLFLYMNQKLFLESAKSMRNEEEWVQ